MSVSIVTGAARGIGYSIAEQLARRGSSVAVWDVSVEVEQSAERLRALGVDALGIEVDVASAEAVEDALAATEKQLGAVTTLVNNAGITRPAMLHKMTTEQWDAVLGVNLTGCFNTTRSVARSMIARGNGAIVNVTALSGLRGAIGQINYVSAKAGLIGLTKAAAKELARYNIRVNAVAPGVVETEMSRTLLTDERFRETYIGEIPLGRVGKPVDIATVVAFLVSDDSAYVTGQVVAISGGSYM